MAISRDNHDQKKTLGSNNINLMDTTANSISEALECPKDVLALKSFGIGLLRSDLCTETG